MHIVSRPPSEAAPARMGALAVLPVFFALRGKRVVVAGGSEAAAWKAELLAASGAEVHVFAPAKDSSPTMQALVAHGGSDGRIEHDERTWEPADLRGAALAVGDVEGEQTTAFVAAARAAGVPVNVIDQPDFCDFQFGSIVNRSPVVVGISTDGAAPILGQAIRRRIETLLPQSLAAWAQAARAVRTEVMTRLKPGAERRAFWERFVDIAFAGPVTDTSRLFDKLARGASGASGRVTLVGAGPGDAELLTLKAVRALQSADVILFDDLVSAEILELARREAKRMLVGKRGGRQSCKQEEINALMLSLARKGKHVVRLKSGDPMIFGRAGEEIAMLEANGIPVSVVPGISAGIALASRLGVSLTHRDLAQSVRFVTGHSRKGGLQEDLDWHHLSDPRTTTVFYMCRSTLAALATRLGDTGMAGSTPIVVAANLGRTNEKLLSGTLSDVGVISTRLETDDICVLAVGQALGARAQQASGVLASDR